MKRMNQNRFNDVNFNINEKNVKNGKQIKFLKKLFEFENVIAITIC